MSRSTAEIDLNALTTNLHLVKEAAQVDVCAVVKADGYGHGAVACATAAITAGASMLGVAHAAEAAILRRAGLRSRILLLSEPTPEELPAALSLQLEVVVHRAETIARLADADGVRVHLKIDTGMGRIGCRPEDALDLARAIDAAPGLELVGTMTHLAVADEPGNPTTDEQLDRFDDVLAAMADAGIDPGLRHAANSAGAIAVPRSRYDMVRSGIALYGLPPSPELDGMLPLRPVLRWVSEVRHVKRVRAGERVSYGHRYTYDRDTVVATIPVGYADGYRRRLGLAGGEVLVRGERRPIRGVVTMDQLMVDCGPDADVEVGDEAVLIGEQGSERITADELAERLDTINYEITCLLSPRVERRHGVFGR